MANFVVYKYSIKNDSDLFSDTESFTKQIQAVLTDSRSNGYIDLKYIETDEDGNYLDTYEYSNDIKMYHDGVITIQVHEHKIKLATPEHGTEKSGQYDDYPWIWVIIDTRPNSNSILIQKKSDAFRDKTDFVVQDLIIPFFTNKLDLTNKGYQMSAEVCKCKGGHGQIWQLVKHRTKNGRDSLKSLSVRFTDERTKTDNTRTHTFLDEILDTFKSHQAELQVWASNESNQKIQETMPDMIGIAEQLLDHDYSIKLAFCHSGTFECSRDTQAIYGVQDSYVERFGMMPDSRKNEPAQYALIDWIDSCIINDSSIFYEKIGKYKRPKPVKKTSA